MLKVEAGAPFVSLRYTSVATLPDLQLGNVAMPSLKLLLKLFKLLL